MHRAATDFPVDRLACCDSTRTAFASRCSRPSPVRSPRILIPREIEVVVGDGTQHDIVAAVGQTIREILGAPSRDVVPDVSAPPALGETGIDDVDRLPFAM